MDIPDSTYQVYLTNGEEGFDEKQREEYRKHPMMSLNRCIFKKIPVSESVKAIMVCVHERADEKGYPSQTPFEIVPPEASVIRFAELIDIGVRTTMKDNLAAFRLVKEKIWEREQNNPGNFAPEFLEKISESLI